MNLFKDGAATLVAWIYKLQRHDKCFDHCHSLVIVKDTDITQITYSHPDIAPHLKNKRSLLWQTGDGLLRRVRWDWSYIEGQVIFYCPGKFDYLGKSVSTTQS